MPRTRKAGQRLPARTYTLKEALVDDYVTDVLLTTMQLPDAVTLFAAPGDEVDIPALKERLGLLESALAKLSMQNAMNQISDKVFNANAAEIGAEMEQIRAEIAETGQVNPAAVLVRVLRR